MKVPCARNPSAEAWNAATGGSSERPWDFLNPLQATRSELVFKPQFVTRPPACTRVGTAYEERAAVLYSGRRVSSQRCWVLTCVGLTITQKSIQKYSSVEATHMFARFASCRCDSVTDTWPEACMERLISLLRAWIHANETGRDPRTSRAAEHNTVTRSTSREVRWLRWSNT